MFSDVHSKLLDDVTVLRLARNHARDLYEPRLADRFNPLDFVRLDELGLSRIIGWLLNPRGSHAQGGRFLRAFTGLAGQTWNDEECARAEVGLEVAFAGSRIDILVRSSRTLAIENKPWAIDQPMQVERYINYMKQLAISDVRLVYLTPDGSEPSALSMPPAKAEAAVSAGELVLWSYSSTLLSWLRECKNVSEAPRVTAFIDDICRAVLARFVGSSDLAEIMDVAKVALRSPDNIRSALQIANAQAQIRNELLVQLRGQLETRAHAENASVEWTVSDARWSGVSFSYNTTEPYRIRFEFEGVNFNGLFFGVKKLNPDDNAILSKLASQLNIAVGTGRAVGGRYWVWNQVASMTEARCNLPRDWSHDVDLWARIPSGEIADEMIRVVKLFYAAILGTVPTAS